MTIEEVHSKSCSKEHFLSYPGVERLESEYNHTDKPLSLSGYFPDLRHIEGSVFLGDDFIAPNLEEIRCKNGNVRIDNATCPLLSKIKSEGDVSLSGHFSYLHEIRSNGVHINDAFIDVGPTFIYSTSNVVISNTLSQDTIIRSTNNVEIYNVHHMFEHKKAILSITAPSMDVTDCDDIKYTHIDPTPEMILRSFTYEELKAKDEYARIKKSELPEELPKLTNEHKKILQEQIDACYKLLNSDRQLSQNKAEQKNVQPSKIKLSR